MDYAIIAAGEGARLAAEGLAIPKPLVTLHGECLVDRLIRIFAANQAHHIYIVVNSQVPSVMQHLQALASSVNERYGCSVDIVAAHTPSSMHSLHFLTEHTDCGQRPFCLTTVDTVFREDSFACYIDSAAQRITAGTSHAVMGVTTWIDDERPLYVEMDAQQRVIAFSDSSRQCTTISAGVYTLSPETIPVLQKCIAKGEQRMRNFQRALLQQGLMVHGADMGKVIDVDHRHDLILAEAFVSE